MKGSSSFAGAGSAKSLFDDLIDIVGTGVNGYFSVQKARVDSENNRGVADAAVKLAQDQRASFNTTVKWIVTAVVVGGIGAFIMRKK